MSMTTVIIIFIGIGILTLVSIFLGILNWISLATTSSGINELQKEIEKKYKKSDSREKDTSVSDSYSPPPFPSPDQRGMSEPVQQPQQQMPPVEKEQQIEIVRNIRGEFEITGETNLTQVTVPLGENLNSTSIKPDQSTYVQQPADQLSQYKETTPGIPEITPNIGSTGEDVLEVVDEQKTSPTIQQIENNNIAISLYSKASKDADFNNLWKTLTQALESTKHLQVTVDFKQILFLYDKEIDYLHKIHKAIELQQGTLSFTNCSPELISILSKDPALCNLVVKE